MSNQLHYLNLFGLQKLINKIKTALSDKVDKVEGKGLSTEDYTTAEKEKLSELTNDYTNHTNKPSINSVTLSGNKTSYDLGLLPLSTKYGASISVTINDSTYVVTAILKDQDGNTLGTPQTIDLPLESMVVDGEYDDTTEKIILTLKNGQTVEFSVADLVAGLQTEITAVNKLSADLVDDTDATNKFMTASEKTKLSGIESEANKTIVDSTLSDTSTNPVQNQVINSALSSKVDKVTGKGLSTEDYTTDEKTKLAGLTNDYTNHTNKPSINGTTLSGNKTSLDLGLQAEITESNLLSADLVDDTDATNKFMTESEKTKLSGIETGANKTIVDSVLSDTSTNPLQNKAVKSALSGKVDKVTGKGLSTEDYTTAEKTKLSGIETGANKTVVDSTLSDTSTNPVQNQVVKSALSSKVDKVTGKQLSTEDYTTVEKTKLAGLTNDYDNHTNKPSINGTTLSGNKTSLDLGLLPSSTKYGTSISVTIDDSTYVVTIVLKDQDGNTLGTAQTIDLPLESMVVDGEYDDTTKKIILTLKNDQTVEFSVADLVAGLQTEITSSNKLSADLVDDTDATNKFMTAAEKTKLSGIESEANKTVVDSVLSDTSTNPLQNKTVKSALNGKVDKVTGKGLSTEDYTTSEKTKLAGLTNDYDNHTNKPSINSVTLSGNKTISDLGLQAEITEDSKLSADLVDDADTTNKFMTAAEKTKLSGIETGANKTVVDSTFSDTSTNPVQNKVVKSALSGKVDKVTGKGLSTEDYTTAEKNKLSGLTNDYTNHTNKPSINSVTLSGNKTSNDLGLQAEITESNLLSADLVDDTDADNKFVSAAEKTKLSGIESEANKTIVDSTLSDTSTNPVQNQVINSALNGKVDKVTGKGLSTEDYTTTEKTKLSGIETGANKTIVDSVLSDTSTNPVQNKAVKSALSSKVDKVTGKQLSTEDYTTAEKTKLTGLTNDYTNHTNKPSINSVALSGDKTSSDLGLQAEITEDNKLSADLVDDTDATNKFMTESEKTKLSGIETGANKTIVDSALSDTSTNPLQNKAIKSALSSKVDKVTGKGLSTEDYTSEEKTKLSGIATGANKTVVDSALSDTSTNPVQNKAVKSALSGKVDKVTGKGLSTEDYTTVEKTKLAGLTNDYDNHTNKPQINSVTLSGNKTSSDLGLQAEIMEDNKLSADLVDDTDADNKFVSAAEKNKLSGIETGANKTVIDSTLSDTSTNPVQNKAVKSALSGKVDKVTGKGLSTEDYTTAEKTKLSGIEIGANKTIIDSTLSDTSTNPVQNQVINSALIGKVDKVTGKQLSTEDYTTTEKTKLAGLTNDYANHTNKPSINSVTLSGNKTSLDLGLLPSSTKYGTSISVTIDDSTYVVTVILKDQDGNTLGTAQTIDLPLESMVVDGEYDDTTKIIILTLKNGQTVEFSVADLVAGLQPEITVDNKLSADLVDDTDATNKFMTAAEKTKLSGIATGANKTVVDSALSGTSTNPVQNKVINSALSGKVDKVTGKGLSTEDYTTTEKTKLSGIESEANKTVVDSTFSDTSTNPVQNKVIKSALSSKVDKVTGKQLSTEDYTTTEKTKLAGLTNDYTNHTNKPQINSITLSGNKTSSDLGLQADITEDNKLSADLVDDTDTTNKFMTAAEKTKLSGIETGANKTMVDSTFSDTSTNPVQNKVIKSALSSKVDKVTGKGLSTEDYTTAEKTKLSGIESEANKTIVDSALSDTSTNPVQNKAVKSALSGKVDKVTGKGLSTNDYTTTEKNKLSGLTNDYTNHTNKPSINSVTLSGNKTSSDLGLQADITEDNKLSADLVDDTDADNKFMTAAEKTKLSGIATGANKTVVDSALSDSSTNPVQNQVINSALSSKVDKVTGKQLSTEDYTTAEKTKLSGIATGANKTVVDSTFSDTSTNPVQNQVINSALSSKVDKVTGKGLSTEDYTTAEKTKLAGLTNDYTNHTNRPSINGTTLSGNKTSNDLGLQAEITESNLLSADLVDDTDATNKFMTAAEKTKLSGIATGANKTIVDSALNDSSTNPVQNQVINSALSGKVDKVTGKQLSTEDYTSEEKTKLSGIATGANKTVVDSTFSDTSTNPVQNKVIKSALSGKVDKVTGKGLSTEDYTTTEKTKLAGLSNDYTNHTNKPQINSVTLSGNKTSLDLGLLPSSTKYGASISVTIDDSTYVVTAILKDQDGNTLGTAQTIDLPLESMVVDGEYDDTTKKIILTLKNDQTVEFSVADLVAGLQTEITSSNKLSADLVDDTDATNKFMTAAEKTKLSGIATGANKTTVDSALSDTSTNPVQNKAVKSALSGKVDKVTGKGLSTEDYTTTEKTKLSGIESEANKTIVDSALSDTSTNPVQNQVINSALSGKVDKVTGKGLSTEDYTTTEKTKLAGLTNDYTNHTNKPSINSVTLSGNKTSNDLGLQAEITEDSKLSADLVDDTDTTNKFMTAAEKTKLSGIATGANKTVVDSALSDTSTNPVQNKAVKSALSGKVDKVTGKGLSTEDYTTVEKTKLAGLTNDYANHTNKPSINSVTLSGNKTSLDLGLQAEITEDNKLSADLVDDTDATNKFMTAAEKTKLSGIATGANKTTVDSTLSDTSTNPVQNKVVKSALSSKVDKVTGKGLSTEDYTSEEKTKLAGLTNDYTNHTNKPSINSVALSGDKTSSDLGLQAEITESNLLSADLVDDTDATNKFMTAAEKTKLSGIETGANKTVVDSTLSDTSTNPVQNQVINSALSGKVDKVTGKGLSTNDYTTAEKTKLSGIETGANKTITDTALNDYSANPVRNWVINIALSKKVDKVAGKGLSTEDYTSEEKTKLSGIETGANKTIVDTALSDTSTNPVQNKAVKSALSGKVDKVTGKGLSTEDYTTAEKTKLSGIETGANKTIVDTALSDTSTNPVQNKVIKENLDDKYPKAWDVELSQAQYDALPASKYVDGKCYWISDGDVEDPIIYGFHVDPDESDSSDAVTYLMDAVGMEPARMGTTAFNYGSWKNAFFMPKPCMLKYDGTVDYYLDPNDYTKKADGTPSDISDYAYQGNVMIEFPKMYYKFENGNAVGEGYFYVSDQKVDDSYKCWCYLDADGNETEHFYVAAYNGVIYDGKMRSLSGKKLSPWSTTAYSSSATYAVDDVVNNNGKMWKCITAVETAEEFDSAKWEQFGFNGQTTETEEINYAKANNTTEKVEWYTNVLCDRMLINGLLVLISKSLDTQGAFGRGIELGSQTTKEAYVTGSLDDKGLFYGSSGSSTAVKVFGIENWWACVWHRTAGLVGAANNTYLYKMTYSTADESTANGYNTDGAGYLSIGNKPTTNNYITKMQYGLWGCLPIEIGSYSTQYFSDYWYRGTGYALFGGRANASATNGAFSANLGYSVGDRNWAFSSDLSCKPCANNQS